MTDNHCCSSCKGKDKEIETLRILLAHWIEHNKSHEEGFREWAEKLRSLERLRFTK